MGVVRAGLCVEAEQIPQAQEPIARRLLFLPGDIFSLSHRTPNSESFPRSVREAPVVSLVVGGCVLIFCSLDHGC